MHFETTVFHEDTKDTKITKTRLYKRVFARFVLFVPS